MSDTYVPELPQLTGPQQLLVERTLPIVAQRAALVRWKYPGISSAVDLENVGGQALCRAAIEYREEHGQTFASYAAGRIHWAMLDALRAETLEQRVKRSGDKAAANFFAFLRDDFNGLVHGDDEISRRYRSIADDLLTATFTAGVEEAAQSNAESELAERQLYARAIEALGVAVRRLARDEQRLLALLYHQNKSLAEAAELLGIAYVTARRRHQRALEQIRLTLEEYGVDHAPSPPAAHDPPPTPDAPRPPVRAGPQRPRDG